MIELNYDLRDAIAALTLAICSEKHLTPEQSFEMLESSKKPMSRLTDDDYETMIELHEQHGIMYVEIADMYGVSSSNLSKRISRYRDKKRKQLKEVQNG